MAFPFGAIAAGDPIGHFMDTYNKGKKQGDQDSADSLFGQTLREMFQSAVPGSAPMTPGVQPVPPVGGGPAAGGGAPAAGPQSAQPLPPAGAARPPGTPAGGILPFPPGGSPPQLLGGGGSTPSGAPPGSVGNQGGGTGGGPPGGGPGPQQPQSQGPLTLQQVIQSVIKTAGPKADPKVIAGAVERFIPLMNQQSQQDARELMLRLREQTVGQGQQRIDLAKEREDRLAEENKVKQDRWKKIDEQSAQRLQVTLGRFDTAIRNQSVNEARQALAEVDKLISERTTMAAQIGIQFSPEEVGALMRKRQELQAKVDAMRAQPPAASFKDRFAPGGGVNPVQTIPQTGGGDVPYAPPQ